MSNRNLSQPRTVLMVGPTVMNIIFTSRLHQHLLFLRRKTVIPAPSPPSIRTYKADTKFLVLDTGIYNWSHQGPYHTVLDTSQKLYTINFYRHGKTMQNDIF